MKIVHIEKSNTKFYDYTKEHDTVDERSALVFHLLENCYKIVKCELTKAEGKTKI